MIYTRTEIRDTGFYISKRTTILKISRFGEFQNYLNQFSSFFGRKILRLFIIISRAFRSLMKNDLHSKLIKK